MKSPRIRSARNSWRVATPALVAATIGALFALAWLRQAEPRLFAASRIVVATRGVMVVPQNFGGNTALTSSMSRGLCVASSGDALGFWDFKSEIWDDGHINYADAAATTPALFRIGDANAEPTLFGKAPPNFAAAVWTYSYPSTETLASHWSPNGRWIVTAETQPTLGVGFQLTSLITNSALRYVAWPDFAFRRIAWLPDSSGWLEACIGAHGLVVNEYGLRNVTPVESWTFPTVHGIRRLYGATPDGRLLLDRTPFASEERDVRVDAVDLRHGQPPKPLGRVTPPSGMRVAAAILSPNGRSIAWTMARDSGYVAPHDLAARLLSRVGLSAAANRRAGIWVSRVDGSGMRCIGVLEPTKEDPVPVPRMVIWTADSNRLRYTYHNALYEVPAD